MKTSDVNLTLVKVSLQQWDLPLKIMLLLNDHEYITSMKQTTFWRCFLQRIEFNGFKHLTEEVTAVALLIRARIVVDHTMPTPLQTAKISKGYCIVPVH